MFRDRRHQNQKAYFITDSVIIDGFAEKSSWVYVKFGTPRYAALAGLRATV
jgi:hypothetical protein